MDNQKIKSTLKSRNFWGYILTAAGSFLAGSGDFMSFVSGLVAWFK